VLEASPGWELAHQGLIAIRKTWKAMHTATSRSWEQVVTSEQRVNWTSSLGEKSNWLVETDNIAREKRELWYSPTHRFAQYMITSVLDPVPGQRQSSFGLGNGKQVGDPLHGLGTTQPTGVKLEDPDNSKTIQLAHNSTWGIYDPRRKLVEYLQH